MFYVLQTALGHLVDCKEHQKAADKHKRCLDLEIELEVLHDAELQINHLLLAVWVLLIFHVEQPYHLVERGGKWLVEFGSH